MIGPFEHQENVKRMRELTAKGFKFDITSDGYQVFGPNHTYYGGASVMLPRSKPLHWRHRVANIKNNIASALATVDRILWEEYQKNLKTQLTSSVKPVILNA